jgi:dUTP pyrophosphatase
MIVPVFREDGTTTPERKSTEAAAFDVTAYCPDEPIHLYPLEVTKVPTGLYVALPKDSTLLVCSRSGLAARGIQVINAPGIIDSDYRDEICVLLSYTAPPGTGRITINHGDRIAQLLFVPPLLRPTFVDVPDRASLPVRDTTRRGGFGSTGI